jgi:transposase
LFIELNKAGNSKTSERQDLIKMFVKIFGANRIEELVGDPEFIGDAWIRYLHENGIPFVIRVKENMKVPWVKKPCYIKDFLINWDVNRPRLIEKDMFGTTVCFACKKMENGELLIVMTNQNLPASRILSIYKQRWTIESLFKNLKTAGFNWENTHMTDPERLTKLLIVMGLATLFVYLIGVRQKIPFRKTLNCPLRSYFRAGLLQMQHLMSQSVLLTINWLISLLSSASTLFQKNGG